jgi:hypothetical protein
VRRKTIPEPAGAGSNRMFTGAPLWRPIPENSITDAMVFSKWSGSTNQYSWLAMSRKVIDYLGLEKFWCVKSDTN